MLADCLRSANPADPLEYCDIWKPADTCLFFWIRLMTDCSLLVACCLLLIAFTLAIGRCWLLQTAMVVKFTYFFEKWSQISTKSLQNWGQNDPTWYQMGSKIDPLRVWAHFWRPLEASSLFLTFVGAILGSILKVFWGQKAWKNNQNIVKQM